jgi:hypothetical protein
LEFDGEMLRVISRLEQLHVQMRHEIDQLRIQIGKYKARELVVPEKVKEHTVYSANSQRHEHPPVLDAKKIQDILKISKTAAYSLLMNPPFKVVRIGRIKKVSRDSFFDWLEGQNK